ncbi:MAG: BamA/TamA family outer membrane protein [Candidatus Zixiibacteriota bacterium]
MIRSRCSLPNLPVFIAGVVSLLIFVGAAQAQYTEIKRESARVPALRILFTKKLFILESGYGEGAVRESYSRKQIEVFPEAVKAAQKTVIDAGGFHVGSEPLPLQDISSVSIERWVDTTILIFYRFSPAADSIARSRKGHRTTFNDLINVTPGDFCRGHIFSVVGNVIVDGEVQKDVISLFGNVIVGAEAVIRGDIATIDGTVKIARQASVYGTVHYEKEKRKFLSQRHRDRDYVSWGPAFGYNRVDGATPAAGIRFDDPDSLLPSLWVNYGYAFESGRIRFNAGFDQPLYRPTPVFLGGEMYQRLGSDDDWIIDDVENTVFALLVTEDFKDYYEARGGRAWIRIQDSGYWNISAEYRVEETQWFDAQPNLFSLLGGDKRFIPNFGHAPGEMRDEGIAEIDSSTMAEIQLSAQYDSRDDEEPLAHSAWIMTAALNWSDPDIGSSFDFRRYMGSIARQQRWTHRTLLTVRASGGGSDGYLPLHRRFTLGGLGTLRGYRHKEFFGSRWWMANVEYRIDLPKSPLSLGLIYDVGQISNDAPLNRNIEVKHSIGVNVYFIEDDFSLSFCRRLDGIDKPTLQIFARFSHDW